MEPPAPPVTLPKPARVLAFDRLRGLVIALMILDHAVFVFSAQKVAADSAYLGGVADTLTPYGGPFEFLSRWITHLCAPTFLFLVGAALVSSVGARRAAGASERSIDSHLIRRGLLLILCEAWMSLAWGVVAIQVMWAIGATLLGMVVVRRLPWQLAGLLGTAWLVGSEAVLGWAGLGPPEAGGPPVAGNAAEALLLVPRVFFHGPINLGAVQLPGFSVANYPAAHWLAIAAIGWAFGHAFERLRLRAGDAARPIAARRLFLTGIGLLALYMVIRFVDGYGNAWMERPTDSWLRWLQVSKYPPSLAFATLELGLGAWILAALLRWQPRGEWGPLVVLGRCSLFVYVIHIHLMEAARWALSQFDERFLTQEDMRRPDLPVEAGWIAAALTIAFFYPVCVLRLRAARPDKPTMPLPPPAG